MRINVMKFISTVAFLYPTIAIATDPGSSVVTKLPIDCRNIDLNGYKYDLSSLNKYKCLYSAIPN